MKKVIYTKEATKPIGPYSQAIESQGFLFCSGQIPVDAKTGEVSSQEISGQTKRTIKNLEAVLKEAGGGLQSVVKTTIFLKTMEDFQEMNKVYASYFFL